MNIAKTISSVSNILIVLSLLSLYVFYSFLPNDIVFFRLISVVLLVSFLLKIVFFFMYNKKSIIDFEREKESVENNVENQKQEIKEYISNNKNIFRNIKKIFSWYKNVYNQIWYINNEKTKLQKDYLIVNSILLKKSLLINFAVFFVCISIVFFIGYYKTSRIVEDERVFLSIKDYKLDKEIKRNEKINNVIYKDYLIDKFFYDRQQKIKEKEIQIKDFYDNY